ncbi:mechanosensitive ion channel (plasmid) [Dinoroseobacter shibae DFL 12 = DSM 16493]|jgi:small-conductance mechanosensitive channel|uniref:Mechanosensitive ion channel n=1 Tax=Dinoroseobacter shibae (strain DSM 16493 / NCIMB 14021 / DFL 12) TaxID=398580 RepID=A8LTR6_DINSH|nr:mechanosensitive ion channel family protein [Dinoroseobacter shibae]ABV95633.1 mechanosensitive ion channel [Dinoroseobacter shibae DFL 12 = DSM 16493]URF48841.1 mechanosensitive ion channel family protein [Dinoroseobacter shibae]URF53153.1 mechanosensitive ion channel family protein [Dinoroseobacter shibae]
MEEITSQIARWGDLIEGLPAFLAPAALLLAAVVAALQLHALAFALLSRFTKTNCGVVGSLAERARRPLRLAFILAALAITIPQIGLPYRWESRLGHLFLVLLIVLVGWTVIILTSHFSDRAIRRHRLDTDDNLQARKFVTQVRVLKRTANIVFGILTAGAVLLTFESVQRYGVSLFASAGAAGLILGFAARPVLANLIAGIQIAITQPIRLDDVVIVEGEWGWIEEIYATYVVVRIWDWRRMVVPLSYFIEKPFQNWTRENASIIGAVYWYMDYTVPIAEMRAKLEKTVENSPHWDGQVVNLQVTDTDKDTLHIRGLMSARTSPQAWDLRCEVREKLIAWLQAEYPEALPRLRGELEMRPERASGSLEQADAA